MSSASRLPGIREMLMGACAKDPTDESLNWKHCSVVDPTDPWTQSHNKNILSEAALRIQQHALEYTTPIDSMARHHKAQFAYTFPERNELPSAGSKRHIPEHQSQFDVSSIQKRFFSQQSSNIEEYPGLFSNQTAPSSSFDPLSSRFLSAISASPATVVTQDSKRTSGPPHFPSSGPRVSSYAPAIASTNPAQLYPIDGDSFESIQEKLRLRKQNLMGQLSHIEPSSVMSSNHMFPTSQMQPFNSLGSIELMMPPKYPLHFSSNLQDQPTTTTTTTTTLLAPQPQSPPQPRRRRTPNLQDGSKHSQCIGVSQKKNEQCRNAALMDYIGPRPMYCAEHIHLDENSLYQKCAIVVELDFRHKYCKEVVLKEFGVCFKHLPSHLTTSPDHCLTGGKASFNKSSHLLTRSRELLDQLQDEATAARQSDSDLFQRKIKLIPKYQSLVRTLEQHVAQFNQNESTSSEAAKSPTQQPEPTTQSSTEPSK